MAKQERFTFEKFVNDIIRRETLQQQEPDHNRSSGHDNLNREYDRLYREKWQNRVWHVLRRGK